MDPELIPTWIRTERLELADFLDDLTAAEWRQPSLCDGWTTHEVLAHITLSNRETVWDTVKGIVRARFDWNRMTADQARDRAASYTPAQLLGQLREAAGTMKRAPGASPLDPLVDIIVHGQDIARPLGRTWRTPVARVLPALDQVLASRFYGAPKRVRGLRLSATDADWTYGDGPDELSASAIDLLMLATGRLPVATVRPPA
ncbi:maleylpyruvate isomerase family mycothiol-dependent enzyme [Nocardia sp. NPDC127526]|uniref:maleylpyruvate isomerase family mycothiol-dependent enzyme n=1 Tax=Nocardia sp. NPDC127526 TaxID=3345393 RepID=UPI003628EDC2